MHRFLYVNCCMSQGVYHVSVIVASRYLDPWGFGPQVMIPSDGGWVRGMGEAACYMMYLGVSVMSLV